MSSLRVRIGPAIFDLQTDAPGVIEEVRHLYRDYPQGFDDEIYDFSVRARRPSLLRRVWRENLVFEGDFNVDDVVPVERRLGLLGFEMAINLQLALGYLRHIVIHAASAAHGDEAVLITGQSGAGKSTLAALLAYADGWRHLGDELAFLELARSPAEPLRLLPYPRPIGLKNRSIGVMEAHAPAGRFGPLLEETVKGTVRHLLPPRLAIDAMDEGARPRLILSPRFRSGAEPGHRRLTQSEAYVRLSTASTNQLRLGEPGFDTLVRLVRDVPAYDLVYGDSEQALKLVDELWHAA